jgi:NTE family protein
MKRGVVLSGGGVRGIAHIGVLKALDELEIKFSIASGTSAGSIIAALYAYGYTPDEILEQTKALSILKSMRPSWARAGFFTMDGLRDMLLKAIPENNFAALKMPLFVAATDIRKGKIHYFSEGELVPAIIASCSIPAIFSPVSFNGGLYVDGGLLDNFPVFPVQDKCDFIVGSHCNQISDDFDARSIKVMIERSLLIAVYANTQSSRTLCDVFIEPPNMDRFKVFEIGKAHEIFETAYRYTLENFKTEHFEMNW